MQRTRVELYEQLCSGFYTGMNRNPGNGPETLFNHVRSFSGFGSVRLTDERMAETGRRIKMQNSVRQSSLSDEDCARVLNSPESWHRDGAGTRRRDARATLREL